MRRHLLLGVKSACKALDEHTLSELLDEAKTLWPNADDETRARIAASVLHELQTDGLVPNVDGSPGTVRGRMNDHYMLDRMLETVGQ